MRSKPIQKFVLAASMSAIAFAPSPAFAQSVPSVSLRTLDTGGEAPHRGEWFAFMGAPGKKLSGKVEVFNPADAPQWVKFYIRDLTFGRDGTPSINDGEQAEVGTWGTTEISETEVPARGTVVVGFTLVVPIGSDPGDHVGAFVAESLPQGSQIKIVKRVATRLYVTVPGDAVRSLEIEERLWDYGGLWPREAFLTVGVRNTGRIRLAPKVQIGDRRAKGPLVLLSQTKERYFALVPVPWYGGPVRMAVEVEDESGLVRRAVASTFVIPWPLLALLLMTGATGCAAYKTRLNRRGRFAHFEAEVRRLEALLERHESRETNTSSEDRGQEGQRPIRQPSPEGRPRRSNTGKQVGKVAGGTHPSSKAPRTGAGTNR